MSENQMTVKVGIVSAKDGLINVVNSESKSPPLLGAKAASGAKNAPAEDVTVAESGASIKEFPVEDPAPAGVADWNVSTKEVPEEFPDPAGEKAVGIPPESEPGPLKDGIDAGGGNVAGELSPMKSFAKVGIVPADDGRITIVISESVSPSLLGAKACGVKNVKDIPVAKCGTEDVLKKDPAAEKAPDAGPVDSDKAKAMFAAHAPSPPAVFWSKFERPAAGAIKGALKKDIPAAKTGAEASVDETGVIKNDPALEPVNKIDTALKQAAVCGETLPSIKEFPEEEPAPAGIDEWALKPAAAGGEMQPSIKEFPEPALAGDDGWTVSAKEFPEEKPAPAGEPDWIVSTSRNKTERKGDVTS
ncbi:hypothetical protein EMIHUDRAFT_437217, partial [Emiliania huxleyi CCMP1516]|uniref:Uncharacterized protein n=2 Tax=Emiliania huxleyi TaxID=2903 RepID=A0A0D3INH6_EMIH1